MTACTGLKQFPDQPSANCDLLGLECTVESDATTLPKLDPDYNFALLKVYGPTAIDTDDANTKGSTLAQTTDFEPPSREQQIRIRNEYIERRMAVIDTEFREFETALAKENVTADFGIALVGAGVGAAGSLVAQTASQILSAVSGGLSAARTAYGKAVLYEQVLSALLAQMQAARKSVASEILGKWDKGLDVYPLWLAKRDVEAYYFAGSMPGAIVATSADAEVKKTEAEKKINGIITKDSLSPEMFSNRLSLEEEIDNLAGPAAIVLTSRIKEVFPEASSTIDRLYPADTRNKDTKGTGAKTVLKRMVSSTAQNAEQVETWRVEIAKVKG